MQLSPLQSRLAASVIATCLLALFYFALFTPHFALAVHLEQTLPVPFLVDDLDVALRLDDKDGSTPQYEPDFLAFDRSIIGRAPPGVTSLVNNAPVPMNVIAGTTQLFVFEASTIFGESASLELRTDNKRSQEAEFEHSKATDTADERTVQAEEVMRRRTKTVYISANTCEQPQPIDPSKTTENPPQLTLFVSTSFKNRSPGPLADPNTQHVVEFTEGAVMYNLTASSDVYFGIHAPNVSRSFSGTYNFQVATSTDGWFHSFDPDAEADLIWVDSDSQGALLITPNLTISTDPSVTDALMQKEPYVMFAQNIQDRSINGLRYSYCGLSNYAQIATTKNGKFTNLVSTSMTRRGPGGLPKQQFYFSGLNSSSTYEGILARIGRSGQSGTDVPGGGGHIFRAMNFTTKSDHGNCQIILNLPFCDQVAYSVPANPTKFANATLLAQFYDSYASSMFDNFKKVLQQIPCEVPASQRYSLARNCTDCEAAYKTWLCSVTIPRCEDFSSTGAFLQPRNIKQPFPNGEVLDAEIVASFPDEKAYTSSRNPRIDEVVQPGPYKEVLPCDDLCYNLVQSCHPAMQFSCPLPGKLGFNTSYGRRTEEDDDGQVTCNYPGSAHVFSGVGRARISWVLWFMGTFGAVAASLLPQL
ncbi:hypothetical protein VTK73DRAFT_7403 [Phialemonium thermophilum]|uniref:FZ domain-containing protein n=1 Tax=Phialemonium thermophilum TaxID=223376 RepID=A0ABR3XSU2_9PEZI